LVAKLKTLLEGFPPGRMELKGYGSEIGRAFYCKAMGLPELPLTLAPRHMSNLYKRNLFNRHLLVNLLKPKRQDRISDRLRRYVIHGLWPEVFQLPLSENGGLKARIRQILEGSLPSHRLALEWHHPHHDSAGHYSIVS
jgi:hypothetical protein